MVASQGDAARVPTTPSVLSRDATMSATITKQTNVWQVPARRTSVPLLATAPDIRRIVLPLSMAVSSS
jgi:hypothetical protein